MRLASFSPAQSVLQLILRNPVKLPYDLEDKNVTTCQLAIVNQGLRNILEGPKQHCIQTSDHCLSQLGVEIGLGPKIKFVLLHSNSNFYLRLNSMQALQTIGQHRSKPYHEKIILSIPTQKHFLDICST